MLLAGPAVARAARPLPDSGKWDRTFALYARDFAVPWKPLVVRLDTYSGAPVEFAAYEVDPADVIVAGTAQARAIDTAHRTAVARWRFTPPPGLRYAPNDVEVPLQNREGLFVIEARRGDAVQQAWIDITRVGLLTKESPGGDVLYGADLGTGKALAGMRIAYLVGSAFQYGKTDAQGIARWTGPRRPRFALAEWGRSKTFVSFLPQAPLPGALVGVRAERSTARAGERLRVIGFARKRVGNVYRPAGGEARVAVVARGRTLAVAQAKLDAAGAFDAELALPADAPAGDAAVLATAAGAGGGAAIHLDGVGDVVLTVAAVCAPGCAADGAVALTVAAKLPDGSPAAGREVRVHVVRSPHVVPPGSDDEGAAWGASALADTRAVTDAQGLVRLGIPAPTDGLASTYGIAAGSGNASASTRIVTPNARVALAVAPEQSQLDVAAPATLDVRGFDVADGRPAAGLAVTLRLVHGPIEQQQRVVLDAQGRARATFPGPARGTNLVFAQADVDGKSVLDVNALTVEPQALLGTRSRRSVEVRIATDKPRYRPGERVTVEAALPGAIGDAFVDLEGARALGEQTVAVTGGRAAGTFAVPETVGDAVAGAAFVRDGALEYATQRIALDAPGHARGTTLAADRTTYAPGSVARITVVDGSVPGASTVAIRLADGRPGPGASFEDAAAVLAATGTTTQNPTSSDPAWHASVAPARSTAPDRGSERSAPPAPLLGAPSERALVWRVERGAAGSFSLPLPRDPGRYVVSVLKVGDDGDVGAATLSLEVR